MTRERLDNRRRSLGFDFRHIMNNGNETRFKASLSLFSDGRPAEMFIDAKKIGSDETAIMRDSAILISIALQNGVSLETMRSAITRSEDNKSTASPIGSALDALSHEIEALNEGAS